VAATKEAGEEPRAILHRVSLPRVRSIVLPFQVVLIQPEGFVAARALVPTAQMFWYALRRLGHAARIARNQFLRDGANIIVGAHLLDPSLALSLPRSTVVFNTEPFGHRPGDIESLLPFARRYPVWDYSARNAEAIRAAVPGASVRVVEAGYTPEFTRVVHRADKDIDALFFGQPSRRRVELLDALAAAGLAVHRLGATYEEALDPWLARAKLVLALQFEPGAPFALSRVVRSLSNRCAVAVEHEPGDDLPADLAPGLALATRDRFVETCAALIGDDAARDALAERGFECIRRRDFAATLGAAIAAEPVFHPAIGGH
jgi:hypothetical protein